MANQDQTPTEATEVSTDVSETALDQVVGGLPIGGIEGESTEGKHKDTIHIGS